MMKDASLTCRLLIVEIQVSMFGSFEFRGWVRVSRVW